MQLEISEKPLILLDLLAIVSAFKTNSGRTPKAGVGGSNPFWDASKSRCKPLFSRDCSFFMLSPHRIDL